MYMNDLLDYIYLCIGACHQSMHHVWPTLSTCRVQISPLFPTVNIWSEFSRCWFIINTYDLARPCRYFFNTLGPRQNGRHFADDIFKYIFLNENISIAIEISLKFVLKGPINNIPALVQIMAWCRPGDKPLSEPLMVSLPTHICVTRPQWFNVLFPLYLCFICQFSLAMPHNMRHCLAHWRCNSIFICAIFKHIIKIDISWIFCEIDAFWMTQFIIDDKLYPWFR